MLTEQKKKQLNTDLVIIAVVSFVILGIYIILNHQINTIVANESISIVLRVLFVGGIFQFGLAGLGITIVTLLRRENFRQHGLTVKKLPITLLLSAACCLPDFIYQFVTGRVQPWLPFANVNTTYEVLASGFPSNVLGMLITAICWGFFEGFNYVVIADKINERFPSRHPLLDWGALVCAVMCILVHGVIGITPSALIDMFATMFLIYGMLVVKKQTGNAWGCVMIFMAYWNAL